MRYSLKGLMIICSGLHAEYQLRETLLGLHNVGLEGKLFKSLFAVVKDEPSQKGLSCRGAKESVMAVFRDIDAYYQVLGRSANLVPELTKLLESAIIVLYHRDLLVKIIVMADHHCYIS